MKRFLGIIILFLISCTIQYFLLGKYFVSSDIIGNFLTFLSIIFGFYITSLAIFVTSKYVSSLYRLTDKKNKDRTLLHELVNNYKIGLVIILLSIFYLILYQFAVTQLNTDKIFFSNIWSFPLLGVVLLNFWYSYKMLDDLVKIILQEAKENAKIKKSE